MRLRRLWCRRAHRGRWIGRHIMGNGMLACICGAVFEDLEDAGMLNSGAVSARWLRRHDAEPEPPRVTFVTASYVLKKGGAERRVTLVPKEVV